MIAPHVLTAKNNISTNNVNIANQSELDALAFEANKTYRLARGQEFYLAKNLNVDNIIVEPYGTGLAPICRGSVDLGQEVWTDEGDGIYSITPKSATKWLYITGYEAKMCETDWIDIVSIPDTDQFGIDSGDLSIDPTGALVVDFKSMFNLSREYTVTGYSSGTVTVDRTHEFGLLTNGGKAQKVKFLNLQTLLTDNYDWCFEGGKLYVKLPSAPSNYEINSVVEDSGFNVTGNNVTIRNIDFKHFFEAAIYNNIYVISQLNINNCNIYDCREDGIRIISRSSNINIYDNIISEIGACGVIIGNIQYFNIYRNTVSNCGTQSNYGWIKEDYSVNNRNSIIGSGIVVATNISDLTYFANIFSIHDNTIYNTAYNGLSTNAAYNGRIYNNVIHDILTRFDDGAGIYTFFYRNAYPQLAEDIEIDHNIIYNITRNVANCGIFQDNRSGKNNIHHNVVYGSSNYCVKVNDGTTDTILEDNIFLDADKTMVYIHNITDGIVPAGKDFVFNRNIICNRSNGTNVLISYDFDCFSPDGNAEENIYLRPYRSNVISNLGNLAALQAAYGYDTDSIEKLNWLSYVSEAQALEDVKLYTNETDSDITIIAPSGYEDVNGVDVSSQELTVPAHYGLLILKS